MRIALVNGNPEWGGGEQWFADAARALARRGHDLLLSARSGTRLLDLFRGTGMSAVPLERLAQVCVTHAPDIILLNSGRDVRSLLRAVGRRRDLRLALRRGLDRPLHDHPLRRPAWKRLSRILVNSEATRATVRRSLRWFPPERITRIYNPVSLEPAERVPPTDATFRLGSAGRLVRQKGIDVLLRAAALLDAGAPWTLEIAGEGRRRRRLERLARRLGLAGRCRFLGHVADTASFYARLDLVVIPSRYEGFCFTAVEAALAGLPVVASDVSSLRELVLDGRTGVLVPPEDPGALARALRALSSDRPRAAALGSAARELARERFDPERLHGELERFLEQAASEQPVGAVE